MVGYDQGSNQNGIFNFSGNFTGDAFGDYLLGMAQSANGGLGSLGNFGGVAKYSIGTQYQWFLQDDWKVTDRLTLNLGLRHELFQQWRGRLANFDLVSGRQLLSVSPDYYVPGVGLVLEPESRSCLRGRFGRIRMTLRPRLGVAYRFKESTVVRAGFGVFHALNTGGATLGSLTSTLPYFVNATVVSSNTTPQLFLNATVPDPG